MAQSGDVADALRALGADVELVTVRTLGDERPPDTDLGRGRVRRGARDGAARRRRSTSRSTAPRTSRRPRIRGSSSPPTRPARTRATRSSGANAGAHPRRAAARRRVGTDSPRRAAFLRARRPDLRIHPLHGNVDTRLRRLDAGETDALVLAVAGLDAARTARTGSARSCRPTSARPRRARERSRSSAGPTTRPPAPGSPGSTTRRPAPRSRPSAAFLHASGGGCRAPIGGLARVEGDEIVLRGATAGIDDPEDRRDGEAAAIARGEARPRPGRGSASRSRPGWRARLDDGARGRAGPRDSAGGGTARAGDAGRRGAGRGHRRRASRRRDLESSSSRRSRSRPCRPAARSTTRPPTRTATPGSSSRAPTAHGPCSRPSARHGSIRGRPLGRRRRRRPARPWPAAASRSRSSRLAPAATRLGRRAPGPPRRPGPARPRRRRRRRAAARLRARGAVVDEVVAYHTIEAPEPSRGPSRRLFATGRCDAIVFTSGSTVRGLLAAPGRAQRRARPARAGVLHRADDRGRRPRVAGFERVPRGADGAAHVARRPRPQPPSCPTPCRASPAPTAPRPPIPRAVRAGRRRERDPIDPSGRPTSTAAHAADRPTASAGPAAPPPSARSCARPGSTRASSWPRSSSCPAAAAGRRSRRCRASSASAPDEAVVDARRLAALGVGGVILFGLPAARTPSGPAPGSRTGSSRRRSARLRDAGPRPRRHRRHVPVRVHRPRPLRPAPPRRRRRQRRRDRAASPRRPSRRPRPAPTSSRRAR